MKAILLSGPMGAGKSTLGKLLAQAMEREFVDLDQAVEAKVGKSVAELWEQSGEAAFRTLEAEVGLSLLAKAAPLVIAVGGGALQNRTLRLAALQQAIVLTLDAPIPVLAERIYAQQQERQSTRPLLAARDREGISAKLEALLEAREAIYSECHARFSTDEGAQPILGPSEALVSTLESECRRLLALDPVVQPLLGRSYRIDFSVQAPPLFLDALAELAPSSMVIVTDSKVGRAQKVYLEYILEASALPRTVVTLPPGEEHKTLASVRAIWDAALGAHVDRDALVVGFGGGVVTDLAGFAASTLLRGLRSLLVPTTLLAMVDASVGGKTGFDHGSGKNMIGTFHQPARVLVDPALLRTLSPREYAAGFAEMVKIALTHSEELFQALENFASKPHDLATVDLDNLQGLIRQAVVQKSQVVARDELETGERAMLNLGHTFGHALEQAMNFRGILHGEAVAIGLCAELRAWSPPAVAARTEQLLLALGLKTQLPPGVVASKLSFVLDKKRTGGSIRVPVVKALGVCEVRRLALRDVAAALS
jgi:shikimate kinase / 3-dehydroquinate synthase